MIAHSLPREVFGPAQRLHGATYIVDAEFQRAHLDDNNIVIDIGLAGRILRQVLEPLNYQNLDELETFNGHLTTTEFLARFIHGEIAQAIAGIFNGTLTVTLGESHTAWASYKGSV